MGKLRDGSGQPPGTTAESEGIFGQSREASSGFGGFGPERQRDIFPLPTVRAVSGEPALLGRSRVADQRRLKRAYIEEWAEDCVQALNEMSGGAEAKAVPSHPPTVMQRCALRHVMRSCAAMGRPPAELTREEALHGLLSNKCYDGQPVALAPLDVDLLSLPAPGSVPTAIAELAGEDGAAMVQWFVQNKVLPEKEAAEKLRRCSVPRAYMDPGWRGTSRSMQSYCVGLMRLEC